MTASRRRRAWVERGTGTAILVPAATSKAWTIPNSFDQGLQNDWTWSERFAAQPEILAYLDHVADRLDLRRHYRFSAEVVRARFDAGEWVVDTSAGDSFRGGGLLHRAWPREDPDLRGKRIGVIGTGSSGIQAGIYRASHIPSDPGAVLGVFLAILFTHKLFLPQYLTVAQQDSGD